MADIWIEDFHQAADGDDWLPAFNRAQAAMGSFGTDSALAKAPPFYAFRGCTLRFGPRSYRFSGPIELRCPMALVGSGGLASYAGSILMFSKGVRGIIVHGANTIRHAKFAAAPDPQGSSAAAGTVIEKLMLLAVRPDSGDEAHRSLLLDQQQSTRRPMAGAHGITLYAHAVLRDVGVSHFDGHGIYVYGLGSGADPTVPDVAALCGLTQGQNVYVTGCGGDGLHIFGNDANVCTFMGLQCVNGYGWGMRDLSRLGQNSFIGCQAAYNALGGFSRPYRLFTSDFDGLAQLLAEDGDHKTGQIATLQARRALPGLDAAELAQIDANIAEITALQTQQAGIAGVLPAAIGTARAALQAAFNADPAAQPAPPDAAHFADLQALVEDQDAHTLFDRLTQYHASLLADSRLIAAEVDRQLAAAGEVHEVSQVNLCLNSSAISNGSEAMGLSPRGFEASIDGGVLAATSGLEAVGPISASGPISSEADIRSGADIHAAAVGDIVLNTDPRIGQPIGWVMTAQGWARFGPISRETRVI